MTVWLHTLARELRAGTPAMLVIVAKVQGSGPREPGARMVVTEGGLFGTIGGGQLEYEATALARTALAGAPDMFVKPMHLGPELGQCCGGLVYLAFEPFTSADTAWVEQLIEHSKRPLETLRTVRQPAEGGFSRSFLTQADAAAHEDDWVRFESATMLQGGTRAFQAKIDGAACTIVERLQDTRQPVWVFGAGHVGRALVRALTPLHFNVTWVDSRADEFPAEDTDGVTRLTPAIPNLIVDEAPEATAFIVMTHCHALDQNICEAVLRRGDARYLGLIGSDTKAARFNSRLKARGIDAAERAHLHCPIGLPGITGKAPEVIAASVAADLLIRFEQQAPGQTAAAATVGGSLDV